MQCADEGAGKRVFFNEVYSTSHVSGDDRELSSSSKLTSLPCLILIGFPELILTISCFFLEIRLHRVLEAKTNNKISRERLKDKREGGSVRRTANMNIWRKEAKKAYRERRRGWNKAPRQTVDS